MPVVVTVVLEMSDIASEDPVSDFLSREQENLAGLEDAEIVPELQTGTHFSIISQPG